MRWTWLFVSLFLFSIFIFGCSEEKEGEADKPEAAEQSKENTEPSDSKEDKPGLFIPKPFNPDVKPYVPEPYKPDVKPYIPKPFVPPKPSVPDVEIFQPKKDETVIRIPDQVLFDFDSSKLRQDAYPVLEEIAKSLNNSEGYEVKIEGHTDSKGSDSYNMKLSQERAEAVRKALVDRYGVSPNILTAVGMGESKPVAPNDTEENRQKNRRVDIKVQPQQ